jgi:ABC-type xylose transport system permease subunit
VRKAVGAFLGLVLHGILVNGMPLLRINVSCQQVVRGALIPDAILRSVTQAGGR